MLSMLPALAFALATQQAVPLECEPLDGWDEVLADDDARYIIIGEMHGTAETPALFADIVCLTGQQEPVLVAVEQPETAQADIEEFMASDGGEEAVARFQQSMIWTNEFKDGRSSEAMFRMFEALRQYQQSGIVTRVVAFQVASVGDTSPEAYETAMADKIIDAAGEARVVAYVGNVHALREEVSYRGGYMPMAGHLPLDGTVTFDTVGNGGETWACSAPNECGVISLGGNSNPQHRHVALAEDHDAARYSGAIYLGTETTPSPPRLSEEEIQ